MLYFVENISKLIRKHGLLLLAVATSFFANAQERTDEDIDILLDQLFFSDQQFLDELIQAGITKNYIYSSLSYSSNTYFSGRSYGTSQFNMIPQISYFHTSGFNASISGIYYEKFSPNWDFTSVSLAYFNTFDKQKKFSYNVGYTRYFFTENISTFNNSLDAQLAFSNKKRTFGTTIAGSYLFGDDDSFQLVSYTFVGFNLLRKPKFALRIRPNISFVIAQQTISFDRIVIVNRRPEIQTFSYNIFDLLNTQLNIPLALSVKSWDFELGFSTNFPNPVVTESNLPTTSLFTFSVGYLIGL